MKSRLERWVGIENTQHHFPYFVLVCLSLAFAYVTYLTVWSNIPFIPT
jgi:hypothetical protein